MTWQEFEQRFSIQLNEQQKQAVQTVEGWPFYWQYRDLARQRCW